MQRGIFPQNFKTLIVMSKKVFKIEELDALTPIKNEEAKFLCGGAEPTLQSDLSKTEGNSTHSSSADADANTQDSDGAVHSDTQPQPQPAQPNWV